MSNPAVEVQQFGQSIWLDYIHRSDLADGTFQRRIDNEGVVGVTSNPAIFQKAIGESAVYDETIGQHLELEAVDVYEALAIEDIQRATDLFLPVYESTKGLDGYVSLEVSPLLANDTEGTIAEARRLYDAVGRPNLMIKIPGTKAGVPAIEATIAAGINVNVTLLFSIEHYEAIAEAYIRGLEKRLEAGEDIDKIASVASFFLSRIDVAVDRILENNMRAARVHGDTTRIAANRRMLGQAAIANAKLAYRAFRRLFESARFAKLKAAGAQVQRPLWASTAAKNPAYPDTVYVDNLIGPHTVNTLPPATLASFIDHGTASNSIESDLGEFMPPDEVLDKLAELGIDLGQITDQLQVDGVDAFIESFEKLIDQVAAKRTVLMTGFNERQLLALGIYANAVTKSIASLDKAFINSRIWNKDGSVWKNHGPTIAKIGQRLGWLDVLETIDLQRLKSLQASIHNSGIAHVVLLGMGGSSLAPEVLFKTFGKADGYPELIVLDSTHPDRIRSVENAVDLNKTLFIVASKSGGTIETQVMYEYFYDRLGGKGEHFIAITDPETQLADLAQEKGFRDTFINPADIGGRYSALSYFGMVPAALIGVDLDRAWESVKHMVEACSLNVPGKNHPGLSLGAAIGAISEEGRDKLTLYTTASISSFGDWVEQLVAESLGKEGRGVVPIVGATVGKPHDYATDRLFVYLRVDNDENLSEVDASIRVLREAGHPRFTLRLPDTYALFGEFFRWEFATAIAGQMSKVNPFDEPNVTEAKQATQALLEQVEETGTLPSTEPRIAGEHTLLYINDETYAPLRELCRAHGYDDQSRTEVLAAQIAGTHAGDYFSILAYLEPTPEIDDMLRRIQRRLRHATKRAVTVGYGPRYLHSTGQLHKGGPNTGVFFQITAEIVDDLAIPGRPYSFGTLIQAQAAGDLQALQNHHRRAFRLHIENQDVMAGLEKVLAAIEFVDGRRL